VKRKEIASRLVQTMNWEGKLMSRVHAFALLSLAGIAACSSSPSGEGGGAVGVARASIAVVPPSVDCVRITATTGQTKTYNFDVVPGQGSVLTMN
jgi:hypothetical protein